MRKEVRVWYLAVAFFFIGMHIDLFAQSPINRQDSVVVFKMLEQAEKLFNIPRYDSALYIARQAVSYSRQHHYFNGEAWAQIKINDILIEKDDLAEAAKNIPFLYRAGIQMKDSIVIAISYLHMGQVHLYRDEFDSAVFYIEKSLSGKLSRVRISYTALAYNDLGYTWGRKEAIEKMTEYCLKSLSIYELLGDPTGCAMALGNISTVYFDLGQKEKAIDYAKQSLAYREKAGDINKLALACCNLSQSYLGVSIEEAVKYQQLCVKYAEQSGLEDRLIHSYITSSLVANGQKKNEEAFRYELKTIELLEESQSNQQMLARRYIAAAFYTDMLKQDTSITLSYFNKAIRLSEQLKNKTNLRDVYRFTSDYYIRKKDFEKGYSNYKKHILYKDSLALSDREQNINDLEARYQTAKKDIEIERLNSEQRIRLLEIEKQNAIINGNMLVAKQKENEINLLQQDKQVQDLKLSQQKEELLKQQLLARNKEQELTLIQKEKLLNEKQLQNQKQLRNGIIAGSILLLLLGGIGFSRYKLKKKLEQQTAMQEMRNHIASDLHDDVGASLSNINILNELTRRNAANPEKVNEYLSKASDDIRQVSEGISDIVWNINPRYDSLEQLFIRMKRYAGDLLDAKNINYTIQFPEKPSDLALDMDKRRDLYLIFKEAINNLAKYSKADHAQIKLTVENKLIRLWIQDNGVGFEDEKMNKGNGLQNMNQRASLLKGKLDINSKTDEGTSILLEIPV